MRTKKQIYVANNDYFLLSDISIVENRPLSDIIHDALSEYYKNTSDTHKTIIKAYQKDHRLRGEMLYDN